MQLIQHQRLGRPKSVSPTAPIPDKSCVRDLALSNSAVQVIRILPRAGFLHYFRRVLSSCNLIQWACMSRVHASNIPMKRVHLLPAAVLAASLLVLQHVAPVAFIRVIAANLAMAATLTDR